MTNTEIKEAMQKIPVGFTADIMGVKVTRWSESAYEVGTWGKTSEIEEIAVESIKSKVSK
jgi:hypothetical protein